MRAIVRDRYGSPDVIRLDDIATPTPTGNEVLVRVMAASINSADLDHLEGRPLVARIGTGVVRPKTPRMGIDVAGVVEARGPDADRFAEGAAVWGDLFSHGSGSFAEYVCVPQTALTAMPEGLAYDTAACLPHSGLLALQGLGRGRRIRPGMQVAVNGAAGCVGPFAIQIAKTYGAEVTGIDHTDKLDVMRTAGADHVIDYSEEDYSRQGERYDFILDIACNNEVLASARALRQGGTYRQISRKLSGYADAVVVGGFMTLATTKRMGVFSWQPNRTEDLEFLGDLVLSGEMQALIDRRVSLAGVPEAMAHLASGRSAGKLVVVPDLDVEH